MLDACKSCGEPAETKEEIEHYTAPFGDAIPYISRFSDCKTCGVQVDLSDPFAFPNAIKESEKTSIKKMLSFFNDHGVSNAAIERQLELPQHCLSHWRDKGEGRGELLALMRVLRAFPWMIEVADSHFDEKIANEKMLGAATEVYIKLRKSIHED